MQPQKDFIKTSEKNFILIKNYVLNYKKHS